MSIVMSTAETAEQVYRLVWMSRPLMQAAEACVVQGLSGTGLTVRMRAVLEVLAADGDLTVPDLARRLEIQRQYVQIMVNETTESGLTFYKPNPRHKTSALVALTDAGASVIAGVIDREKQLLSSITAGIDGAEVRTALRVMSTLIDALKQQTGGTS